MNMDEMNYDFKSVDILCVQEKQKRAIAFLLATFVKTPSTHGRYFIARNAIGLIAEAPLTDHGANGFDRAYMPRQAEYFRHHSDPEAEMLADDIHHPLNAFLFRLRGSTIFRPTGSAQLALGGQTRAAFPASATLSLSQLIDSERLRTKILRQVCSTCSPNRANWVKFFFPGIITVKINTSRRIFSKLFVKLHHRH